MIKGTATLKLINAATGEEEKSVTSENMVTNAIANLLNPPMIALTAGRDFSALLDQIMPICTKALGGVLLWDNTIFENVNTILPPMDINCIGHAGGEYTGTLPRRGSYNTAESGYIDDDSGAHVGYRHVWDFATDKANGTIKSLSLTHLNGGNSGYQTMDTTAKSQYEWGNVVGKKPSGAASYIAGKIDNAIVFAAISSTTCTVSIVKHIDVTNVTMFDADGTSLTAENFSVTLENTGYNYNFALVDGKLHCFGVKSTSGNKASINHVIIDIEGKKKESETIITTADGVTIYYPLAALYSAGSYYLLSRKTNSSSGIASVRKVSADGRCSDDILPEDISWNPPGRAYEYEAGYITPDIIRFGNYMIQGDNVRWQTYCAATGSTSDVIIPAENPCYRYTSNGNYGMSICAFLAYLATINNLPEPVTKTDQQTLKVIYEIRHEEVE